MSHWMVPGGCLTRGGGAMKPSVKYDQSISPKDQYVLRVCESALLANFNPAKTVPPMAEAENLLWRQTGNVIELWRESIDHPPLLVLDSAEMKRLRAGPGLLQDKLRQANLSF